MFSRKSFKPRLELLEDRVVPTVWGIPWTDGSHLSVSFVPDGTQVNGQSSVLFQKMASCGLSATVWQNQIVEALQSWSNATNVEFNLVPDNGAPLGTVGATQGDSRFGDIRIACVPLALDVLAITTPPSPLTGSNTLGGDIVLNANDLFTIGTGPLGLGALGVSKYVYNDLYTVVQHEIGHSLGLPDNSDPASVMYEYYQGPQTSLYPADVSAIQALYGVPAQASNGLVLNAGTHSTFATALPLATTPGYTAASHYAISAFDQNSGQTDVYSITAGQDNTMAFQVTASNNGPLPSIAVYTSSYQQVAVQWTVSGYGCSSCQVANPVPGATYYVALQSNASQTPSTYRLSIADFNESLTSQTDDQGTLSAQNSLELGVITASQTQMRLFSVTASSANADAWVQMTILNALGQVVESLTAMAGQTVGGVATLDVGIYAVVITAGTSDGSPLPPVNFAILSDELTNPVGATISNPNQVAAGSGTSTTTPSSSTASSSSSGYTYKKT